jgi:hypothetical protein
MASCERKAARVTFGPVLFAGEMDKALAKVGTIRVPQQQQVGTDGFEGRRSFDIIAAPISPLIPARDRGHGQTPGCM